MFYRYYYELETIPSEKVTDKYLTAGFVDYDELNSVADKFRFDKSTVETCREGNNHFRSGVDIHDTYTFTELRVININEDSFSEDCVALYIKNNCIICVDVADKDGSTKEKFLLALKKYPIASVNLEKIILAFFDSLTSTDSTYLESLSNKITDIEEDIFNDSYDSDFNFEILQMKKKLLKMHNYYNQILDITETLEENDNEILNEDRLIYISNVTQKVTRLREDVDSLSSNLNHLQDAYIAYIDQKMNKSMKLLSVVATIFLPLSIIVGWYGMNFSNMPELTWQHGYLYVGILSVFSVVFFLILGKIRKWY